MKRQFTYLSFLALLLALSCHPVDKLAPESEQETLLSKETWEIPMKLTGDLETDLDLLAKFAEMDLNVGLNQNSGKKKNVVYLEPNSTDELEAKVMAAGPGGIVVVKSGDHTETGTVNVPHRVQIIGQPGAIIYSGVQNWLTVPAVQPALHLQNADHSVIAGIQFETTSGTDDGGTVVLIENADHVLTSLNQISGFQFGVVLQEADNNRILGNTMIISSIGLTQFADAHGVMVINGDNTKVKWNHISNALFGIWACDQNGLLRDNYLHHNYLGVILCNVPVAVTMPSGQVVGSAQPATQWLVNQNISSNNFAYGYLVIDGANNNTLTNNAGSNNALYDIELTTDTYRFGFLTPAAYENTVNTGPYNLVIKDCGNNNMVNGGTLIDTNLDPCN